MSSSSSSSASNKKRKKDKHVKPAKNTNSSCCGMKKKAVPSSRTAKQAAPKAKPKPVPTRPRKVPAGKQAAQAKVPDVTKKSSSFSVPPSLKTSSSSSSTSTSSCIKGTANPGAESLARVQVRDFEDAIFSPTAVGITKSSSSANSKHPSSHSNKHRDTRLGHGHHKGVATTTETTEMKIKEVKMGDEIVIVKEEVTIRKDVVIQACKRDGSYSYDYGTSSCASLTHKDVLEQIRCAQREKMTSPPASSNRNRRGSSSSSGIKFNSNSSHPFTSLSSSSSGMDLIMGKRRDSLTESNSFHPTDRSALDGCVATSSKQRNKLVSFASLKERRQHGSYEVQAAPWRFEGRVDTSSMEDKAMGLMKRMRSVAPWSRSFDSSDDEQWNKRVRDGQLVLGDLRTMPSLPMISHCSRKNFTDESMDLFDDDYTVQLSTDRGIPLTIWKSDESSESDYAGMWRQWQKKKGYLDLDHVMNEPSWTQSCRTPVMQNGWTMIDENFWSG